MINQKKIFLIVATLFFIGNIVLLPVKNSLAADEPPRISDIYSQLKREYASKGGSLWDWGSYMFNWNYEEGKTQKKQMWETVTYNLDLLTTRKLGPLPSDYDRHPSVIIARVVIIVLNFLAALFIILMVYAGFSWMFAGGNEEKVTKARDIVKNSVIGAILVFGAYAVAYFILQGLTSAIY